MRGRAGVGVLGFVLLAVLVSLALSSWGRRPALAQPSQQPIQFPHNVHVQTYKIDCQYCHADARRSEFAGLPSVTRCMGCHKIVAADRPEIKKLADYAAKSEPIPWVRINHLPEFVYFPHKAHLRPDLRADIKCQTCHGAVENMTTYGGQTGPKIPNDLLNLVGLRPAQPPLSMGWCIDCHREKNATHKTRAPLDCVTCHH